MSYRNGSLSIKFKDDYNFFYFTKYFILLGALRGAVG
jgi:hypothetical protein